MGKNNFAPRSKFEKWVRDYGGTVKLAKKLGVTPMGVQHWCAKRRAPTLHYTSQILKLSRGKLTLKDLVKGTKP